MKKKLIGALAVLGMTGLMAGAMAGPVAAGDFDETLLPSLTVVKSVTAGPNAYTIPSGSLFTIQVSCSSEHGDPVSATLTYNGDGTTHSAPGGWVDGGHSWTFQDWDLKHALCTITEQAGGATQYLSGDPTYACVFTNVQHIEEASAELDDSEEVPGCVDPTSGTTPSVVQFGSPWDRSCQTEEMTSAGESCICVQTGTVTVTNPIADDPAKVLAASASAVPITPKFTG